MKCKCDYSMEGRIAGNIKDFSWVCPICKEVNHKKSLNEKKV